MMLAQHDIAAMCAQAAAAMEQRIQHSHTAKPIFAKVFEGCGGLKLALGYQFERTLKLPQRQMMFALNDIAAMFLSKSFPQKKYANGAFAQEVSHEHKKEKQNVSTRRK